MAHDPDGFGGLDVTAIGTTVALGGKLVGEEARDRAVSVARGTTGVSAVFDRITVRPTAPPPPQATVTITSAPVRDPWWQRAFVPCVLLSIVAAIGAQQWSAAATPAAPAPLSVVRVEGMALFDGKPAAGAKLTFHPLYAVGGVKERPTAIVGSDGRFPVGTYAAADGAPVGPYVVTVEYRPSAAPGKETAPPAEDIAPQAFRSRFTSILNYEAQNGKLPVAERVAGKPRLGWITNILPQLERRDLFERYDFNTDWFQTANLPITSTRISVLIDPSSPNADRLDSKPEDFNVTTTGAAVAIADYASVRFLNEKIDIAVPAALVTRDQNELYDEKLVDLK